MKGAIWFSFFIAGITMCEAEETLFDIISNGSCLLPSVCVKQNQMQQTIAMKSNQSVCLKTLIETEKRIIVCEV
jgi:hypothetical protein